MIAQQILKNFPKCEHEIILPIDIKILGRRAVIRNFPEDNRLFRACAACLQEYFNKYCARCAFCEKPIMPLAIIMEMIDVEGKRFLAHDDCAPPGVRTIWGEGESLEKEILTLLLQKPGGGIQ